MNIAWQVAYDGCPLCGARGESHIRSDDWSVYDPGRYKPALPREIHWYRCTACGHVFTGAYWTPEALALIGSHAQQRPGWNVEPNRYKAGWTLQRVLTFPRVPRVLDVGSGDGIMSLVAKEFGCEVMAIDIRPECAEGLREWGVEAECAAFEDFKAAEPFDLIILGDVIEHLPFPKAALTKARDLLAYDGRLLVMTPNMASPAWAALDRTPEGCPYWKEGEHHHNFTRERLYLLLEECGFEPVGYAVSERYRCGMEVTARRS